MAFDFLAFPPPPPPLYLFLSVSISWRWANNIWSTMTPPPLNHRGAYLVKCRGETMSDAAAVQPLLVLSVELDGLPLMSQNTNLIISWTVDCS